MQTRDQIIQQVAERHFSGIESQKLFIETVVSSLEKDTENLENHCWAAFNFVTNIFIEQQKSLLKALDDVCKEHCIQLMKKLHEDYLKLNLTDVENFLKADSLFLKINIELPRFTNRYLKNFPKDKAKFQQFFIISCYEFFKKQNFKNSDLALAEAELEVFLILNNNELSATLLRLLKLRIQEDRNWFCFPGAWFEKVEPLKKLITLNDIKTECIKNLDNEIGQWERTEKDCEEILTLLLGAINAIDVAHNDDDIILILEELNHKKKSLLEKVNYFNDLGIFSGARIAKTKHHDLKLSKPSRP